jgi:hypothetical protein
LREPDTLAQNILRLLEDSALRRKLEKGADDFLRRRFGSWPQSARNMHEALLNIL